MRDLIPIINQWQEQGRSIALATVVWASGSSPRPVGAKMVVSSTSEMAGSVSGGCVEGDVVEIALQCLQSGKPKLIHYGIADETAWSFGLACGGEIKVFIEPLFHPALPSGFSHKLYEKLCILLQQDRSFPTATLLSGNSVGQKFLYLPDRQRAEEKKPTWVNEEIINTLLHCLENNRPELINLKIQDQILEVFIEPFQVQPRLIIIGAVHIAEALVNYARQLQYKTIVIDPRSGFLTRERFPFADELLKAWPDEALQKFQLRYTDGLVALSHDEKFDTPALAAALNSPVGYIGVLGSRNTREQRFLALKEKGFNKNDLARIHAPIGLDIGAVKPEEIALAIMAEIVAFFSSKPIKNPIPNQNYLEK